MDDDLGDLPDLEPGSDHEDGEGDHVVASAGKPRGFQFESPSLNRCKVGTGRVIGTKFHPPNGSNTPRLLFPPGIGKNASPCVHRFIRRNDPFKVLIYTTAPAWITGMRMPRPVGRL